MVTGRKGHSLAELLVAVTLLSGVLLTGGATALVGARLTTEAILRQEVSRSVGAVMDSLLRLPAVPVDGRVLGGGPWAATWTVRPADDGSAEVRIEARGAGGEMLSVLRGTWTRSPAPWVDE